MKKSSRPSREATEVPSALPPEPPFELPEGSGFQDRRPRVSWSDLVLRQEAAPISRRQRPDLGPVPDFVLPEDWSGKDRTPPPMTPDELFRLSRQFPPVATPRPPMPDFEL